MRLQYWSWVCMCSVVSGLSLVCALVLHPMDPAMVLGISDLCKDLIITKRS